MRFSETYRRGWVIVGALVNDVAMAVYVPAVEYEAEMKARGMAGESLLLRFVTPVLKDGRAE